MLLVQKQSSTRRYGGGRRSDHVDLFEQVLVPLGLELGRPVDDGRLAEAAAAQLEKRRQVLDNAHAADRRVRKRVHQTEKWGTPPLTINLFLWLFMFTTISLIRK